MGNKKVALHNLGCKVNAYETDAMQQLLEEHGYEIVPFEPGADIYIINTCTVTNIADRKSRQMIHKAKKMNPDAIVVAAGCYVQTSHDQAKKDECIDIIVGNNNKKDIVSILSRYDMNENKCSKNVDGLDESADTTDAYVDINKKGIAYETLEIGHTGGHTRAYVKVQDGCNQFCSYCMIPYARGRVRSRGKEDVIRECRKLVDHGYQEIVLTGIHVSSYGTDFPKDVAGGGESLLSLLESVHEIDGLRRIRLSSLEPRIMTESFIRRISQMEKLCPHFHLSLQSGCDATLRRMNRHYTTEEYWHITQMLREYYAHPAITTDIITGFPGETQEEFEHTFEYVKKINFYETHVFKYSKRRGTKAAEMPGQVPEEEKARRSLMLLQLGQRNSRAFREYYIGKTVEALMEESILWEGRTYQVGHTKEYVKTAIPREKDLSNTIQTGIVTGFLQDDIVLMGW